MDDLHLDFVKPEELETALSFYRSMFGLPHSTWSDDYPTAEILSEDIGQNAFFALRDSEDNIVAAAAMAECHEDFLHAYPWSSRHQLELSRVVVKRECQHLGFGSILLSKLIGQAKKDGYDGIRLLVAKRNPNAVAFYEKFGFQYCAEQFLFGYDFLFYELNFDGKEVKPWSLPLPPIPQ